MATTPVGVTTAGSSSNKTLPAGNPPRGPQRSPRPHDAAPPSGSAAFECSTTCDRAHPRSTAASASKSRRDSKHQEHE
jgi:hypothetical protein